MGAIGRVVTLLVPLALLAAPAVSPAAVHAAPNDPSRQVETVSYGPGHAKTMQVDALTDGLQHPVVLFIHGGGWGREKANSQELGLSDYLANSTDWTVATMNYPTHQPRFAVESRAVRQAIRTLLGRDDVDPSHFIAWGESAGGQLAMRAAYNSGLPISAVVGISAPTDLIRSYKVHSTRHLVHAYMHGESPAAAAARGQRRYHTYSPDDLVSSGAPPTFLAVGADDPLIPQSEEDRMARLLADRGIPYQEDVVSGTADHSTPLEYDAPPDGAGTVAADAIAFVEHNT